MNNNVHLEDISLNEYPLGELELIERSNSAFCDTNEVCIERSKLITDYYRANETKGKSAQICGRKQ